MTFSDYKLERVGFSLLLCIALLMFFLPLLRLHVHNGSQTINALNVRYEISQLQSDLRILATISNSSATGASLVSSAGVPMAVKPLPIPFSLRMASLVPWFVFAALGFCLLALLGHFFSQKAVATCSLLGGSASAIAVLHVMLMGSDLRSWTEILMGTALLSSEDPSGAIRMGKFVSRKSRVWVIHPDRLFVFGAHSFLYSCRPTRKVGCPERTKDQCVAARLSSSR